ncbi:MAG: endopeptidase La [Anaerolineales bacterium]|nr:endopeptidase La [Anaerolineales bacterium]
MNGQEYRDWQLRSEFAEVLGSRTEELQKIRDATLDKDGLVTCAVLPLRDLVVFPRMVTPLFVGRESALSALEFAHGAGQTVIAVAQKNEEKNDPSYADLYTVGCETAVGRVLHLPEGETTVLAQGRRRVQIIEYLPGGSFLRARARPVYESADRSRETEALMRAVLALFEKVVQLNRSLPDDAYVFALNVENPGWLADLIVSTLGVTVPDRQRMLETFDVELRLQRLSVMLGRELDVLELENRIHSKVQSEVDRTQREYYLREQMKAIQTELGEQDSWSEELTEVKNAILKAGMPEEVQTKALKELERMGQMPAMAPEVAIVRTYLDWLTDLPWQKQTEDNLDLKRAAAVLDRAHYGLPKAKERILEYLAVRTLAPKKQKQPILCFVGPPGTGKTSLGRSIAETLGRKFVRVSLGGVRDEAEIRGHRRTYIGALPGRILQTMRRAGTVNPLFMLDEIDKLGVDFRGDPAAALLEVLDPEQNHAFDDHYLDLPYDLSRVMFITTANTLGPVPPALLDRMEVIEFPGYIEQEKIAIANRFLIPRQREENGLDNVPFALGEDALLRLIREYTWEAGVRNLDREIARICRKVARRKAEGKRLPERIDAAAVPKFLGPQQFFQLEAEKQDEVGVATALAWTENGGDTMPVEVVLVEGKGNIQITGQIGEVMQESAQAAMSYLKSRAKQFRLEPQRFEKTDVHIHIPEGAIPKDGPSAGITIAAALVSAFTGRKARREVGLTGEITLRGRVLPVGGVRDKVIAAHRIGLKKVIIPKHNKKDLIEIPKNVRDELTISLVEHIDEVLRLALHKEFAAPAAKKPPAAKPAARPDKPNEAKKKK